MCEAEKKKMEEKAYLLGGDMPSLEDLAAVRITIEMCNYSQLKREILSAPGEGSDNYKKCRPNNYHINILQWRRTLEKKTGNVLEKLELNKQLWEKVTDIVILIATRMVMWAEYHERTLGLSREFSIEFFNSSFLTSEGIIDSKRASEELMKDESLSIKQKYKLACLYCLTEKIPDLYRQMSQEDKEEFYDDQRPERINQPGIVHFWSYYLVGKIDELRGEKTVDEYRLEMSIESGSKAAVEYCLEKTGLSRKKDAVIDAALETVRKKKKAVRTDEIYKCKIDGGWSFSRESWIPRDNFVDILCFLLSKMREDQQIEFLKKDIEDANYELFYFENPRKSRVLEYLLDWPYQKYFMETAQLMWDFLPESSYGELLFQVFCKINPFQERFVYDEEKTYRKLFREFWSQSPDRYKRCAFRDQEVIYKTDQKQILKVGKSLVLMLFGICAIPDENVFGKNFTYDDFMEKDFPYQERNFTYEDLGHIELILGSATDEEKESIIYSEEGRDICTGLMRKQKWRILEDFIDKCLPSKEEAGEFKRALIFTKEAQRVYTDSIKRDNWDAAESFIKFVPLSEEEIMRLKREMIYGEKGRRVCLKTIELGRSIETVDKFIRECLPSEEAKAFKKDLLINEGVCELVMQLIVWGELELVNDLFNWGLSSEEEIREVKKQVAYTEGCSLCTRLISASVNRAHYWFPLDMDYLPKIYPGNKWEHVEKLLTWCFSSEEEIRIFKKDCLLKESGKEIHINLINSNQWGEAETFFAWLELSPEEVKELKRETLFDQVEADYPFPMLLERRRFCKDGFNQKVDIVELLLRWCLADKETVLEFRDHFLRRYDRGNASEREAAVLEEFDSAIEEFLSDLEEEQQEERNVGTK